MTRTGHPRARRAVRDHRICAIAAAFMLLTALAASLLVSAGSPHHELGAHSHSIAVAAEPGDVAAAQPAAHEHQHGNEWAPTLGKRIRPAATIGVVGILTARPAAPALMPGRAPSPASHTSGIDPSTLGLLRV
jgi:hypothetical protein